jgi:cytochrome P450
MVELLRNPLSMAKACDELRRVIGSRRNIEESEIGQLPYLQAVIKETFRLHPPVPLLIPRQAEKTTKIMSYTIPKGSRVLINIWAIGRDENVWSEPEKFIPERFLIKKQLILKVDTLSSSHLVHDVGSALACHWLLGWCTWFLDPC